MATKECQACGAEKEANTDNFYKHPTDPDSLENTCKECRKKKQAERKKAEAAGETPMSKEERIAKIKERQAALARRKAASTAVGSAARKITKKREPVKRRQAKAAAKPEIVAGLESDRLIKEITDIVNVIQNGKALLGQKCRALVEALDRESNGQGND